MTNGSAPKANCETCHSTFVVKRKTSGKYCSRSCAATASNSRHPRRKRHTPLHCGVCLKNVQAGNKYCSDECRKDSKVLPWVKGLKSGSYANGTLKKLARNWLLKQADYRCTECGWSESNPALGYPVLAIDHIDGNWRNNAIENLRVICYNCHTLTPTFGALNKANKAAATARPVGRRSC